LCSRQKPESAKRFRNMADETAVDEVRDGYIQCMGQDLGSVFHALWEEVAWIHVKWREYCELFGTRPSRIDLLNEAAPLFFRIAQDALFEDILLHIARLTDPPESCGKKNLTIRSLGSFLERSEISQELDTLLKVALEKADFCRDWRNRYIGHRDFKLALEQGAEALKPASRQKVKAVLVALAQVLNCVHIHYMQSETVFDRGNNPGGALELLYLIDDGVRLKKDREARLNAGEYRPEDCRNGEL
jgi:hypothetical protein